MSNTWPTKSERPDVTAEAAEMRGYLSEAVSGRHADGFARAVAATARDFGLTNRRVLAILRREARRVWADELSRARSVHRRAMELQAQRYEQMAALNRARLAEWDR